MHTGHEIIKPQHTSELDEIESCGRDLILLNKL